MPLAIAQDYIISALRKCGQIRPGYLSQPELLADGLNEWGMLFDSWAAERAMGFSVPQFTYAVTGPGSQQSGNGYSIGPVFTFAATTVNASATVAVANTLGLISGQKISGAGIPANTAIVSVSPDVSIVMSHAATASAPITVTVTPDWIGPRPDSIIRANLKMTNVGPQPVYIQLRPLEPEEWAALSIRQIPAINVTNVYYYDPQFPQGVFNVFPPLNGNSIELFTWPMFGTPSKLSAAYSAPPGYQDAIVYTLAERLWLMCTHQIAVNKVPLSWLAGKAYAARQKVMNVNRPIPTLAGDFRGGRRTEGYYDANVSWTGEPY